MKRSGEYKQAQKLSRAVFALLIAAVILYLTAPAVVDSLGSPEEMDALVEENVGDYITHEVYFILDYYAEEGSDAEGEEVTGRYIVVPQGEMLVTYLVPSDYFDSVDTVLNDTFDWLNGNIEYLDKYFVANGTVDRLDASTQGLFYEWFDQSHEWMEDAGLIGEATDYADYLSPYIVKVGYVGTYTAAVAYMLAVAAVLCLAYSIFTFYSFAAGKNKTGSKYPAPAGTVFYEDQTSEKNKYTDIWNRPTKNKEPWDL